MKFYIFEARQVRINNFNIHVRVVKQGSATSNKGNIARRFFQNPKVTANVIGLDENLSTKFAAFLQIKSCAQKLDLVKFEKYMKETVATVPIRQLSEEPKEACNKDI